MNTQQLAAHLKLQLNTQVPDLDRVWQEGYELGLDDMTHTPNPYRKDSQAYHYWQAGLDAGFMGESNIFAAATESADIAETVRAKSTIGFVDTLKIRSADFNHWALQFLCVATLSGLGYQLVDLGVF